ncbi:DNA cytosine methyltransferase [Marinoscillum sp. 108]|uniref:DNA cytosine methyltransferase n=1 Tax=Marinoscillum sp. 108 TaxID=2653151 RepID=UPI0012EEECA2|nr:DNA cytosine methyltransferase [Marinoscillum sp. 108]VXD19604.1 Modification methylase DdeI [Marinoscillum sp. 108]
MNISSLDLFAGAGGFTLGLKNSGITTIGANEIDRFAAETFRNNFPEVSLMETDIRELSNKTLKSHFSGVDLIVGGPPCQGFSVAGPSQYGILDDRNDLVLEFIRAISVLKPKMVIMENVKNFLNGKLPSKDLVVDVVKKKLKDLDYSVKIKVAYAPDYGIPQSRTRVFIIGIHNKADLQFPRIEPTHGFALDSYVKVEEAIYDLPFIDVNQGFEDSPELLEYREVELSDYQKKMRLNSPGIFNHVSMKHTPRLIERFKHIPQGGSLLDVPFEHGQRVRNGNSLDLKPRFKMNNQRLDPKNISQCITASFQSTFVHPVLNRNLTAREGARLQSFPDHFIFKGPRTLMSKKLLIREGREDEIGLSQYNQIGNSVPPLLAQAIGKSIIESFEQSKKQESLQTAIG